MIRDQLAQALRARFGVGPGRAEDEGFSEEVIQEILTCVLAALPPETPAPTCATCRHFRFDVEDGETSRHYGKCCHPSEAHPLHWTDCVATFGCNLHEGQPREGDA